MPFPKAVFRVAACVHDKYDPDGNASVLSTLEYSGDFAKTLECTRVGQGPNQLLHVKNAIISAEQRYRPEKILLYSSGEALLEELALHYKDAKDRPSIVPINQRTRFVMEDQGLGMFVKEAMSSFHKNVKAGWFHLDAAGIELSDIMDGRFTKNINVQMALALALFGLEHLYALTVPAKGQTGQLVAA